MRGSTLAADLGSPAHDDSERAATRPHDTEEMMRKVCFAATALCLLGGPALAADPDGDWMVKDKTAVIRIAPCGEAVCGNIVWTKGPAGTDQNNPDPAKRSRSVIGLPILIDMKPSGDRWEGEIYNAQDGKIYSGRIALAGENVLRIEGCVLGFLCGGEDWTRAQCDEAPAPAGKKKTPNPPPAPSVTSCREAGR
jgi:uncharacterized protein (DUF2147 family)